MIQLASDMLILLCLQGLLVWLTFVLGFSLVAFMRRIILWISLWT